MQLFLWLHLLVKNPRLMSAIGNFIKQKNDRMNIRVTLLILASLFSCLAASSQKIVYSDYDREDSRKMDLDVVGKISGNFLVYKNVRNKYWFVVFDNDMREVGKVEQTYLPNSDRFINADFFPYSDHFYMIYQYQRKNVVYCMAANIDGSGNILGEPMELDTAHIGLSMSNKIYSVLTSEDKSRIIVFKINSRNKRKYLMTTRLFDDKLKLLKGSQLHIPMEERNDHLGDFMLDNDGDLVFSKFYRSSNDNISRASLVVKWANEDTLFSQALDIDKSPLDEIHVKVDNFNKRYFLTSFYSKERRSSIDGFYIYIWSKASRGPVMEKVVQLGEEIRRDARGESSVRMAFDDFFIRQIVLRRDGGFIIGSESYYTYSRMNNWNRWDYLYGSPYYSPLYNSMYYSPYYNNSFWNSRMGNSSPVRYHADNVAIFSFNEKGELEWNNVIVKSQYNDESDDLLSYQVMNTGDQLHFLTNIQEKRNNLLTDFSLSRSGEMNRNPTLKNLDKGYDFMIKYGKQVSARQMIVPCMYRNYLCFAKIDYNPTN
jgi:hypothetical protein